MKFVNNVGFKMIIEIDLMQIIIYILRALVIVGLWEIWKWVFRK